MTDTVLIQECIAGDREAWESLVRRYERIVYSLACELCPQRHDAEAVFYRVWLELFQHLEDVHDRDVQNWLVSVTGKKCFPIYEARNDGEAILRHYRVTFSCLPRMLEQHTRELEPGLTDHSPATKLWNLKSVPDPSLRAVFDLLYEQPGSTNVPELLAGTIFDTRSQPASSGFRGGNAFRQLIMQAGNIDIHLNISVTRVVGQVKLTHGEKLPGRSSVTLTRGTVVQHTRTNHFGEFRFDGAVKGRLTLTALVPSESCRVIGYFEVPLR